MKVTYDETEDLLTLYVPLENHTLDTACLEAALHALLGCLDRGISKEAVVDTFRSAMAEYFFFSQAVLDYIGR